MDDDPSYNDNGLILSLWLKAYNKHLSNLIIESPYFFK